MSKRPYVYGSRPVPLKAVQDIVCTDCGDGDSWTCVVRGRRDEVLYTATRTTCGRAVNAAINGAALNPTDFIVQTESPDFRRLVPRR